jgi:hypothetical protein
MTGRVRRRNIGPTLQRTSTRIEGGGRALAEFRTSARPLPDHLMSAGRRLRTDTLHERERREV